MSIYSQSVVMYVIIWEQFVTWGEMSVGGGMSEYPIFYMLILTHDVESETWISLYRP